MAREAGVGVGTLYRHFPTREALLVAAHTQQITQVCRASTELLAQLSPRQAVQEWLRIFVHHAIQSTDMCSALEAVIAPGADPYAGVQEPLTAAVGRLLEAGAAEGTVRSDVTPADVLLLVGGVSRSALLTDAPQTERLLELLTRAITTDTHAPGRATTTAAGNEPAEQEASTT